MKRIPSCRTCLVALALALLSANGLFAQTLFESAVNYGVGTEPHSVFSIDLDGDGDNDIATANDVSDNISILINNGNGTFQTAVDYYSGDGPLSLYASKLDGDNDNDLAVANYRSESVSILMNNGNGTFQPPSSYAVGVMPASIFSIDLDGDSDNDLAVANQGSDFVSILKNNGDGTFLAAVNYAVGEWPQSVFSIDLDDDGDNDLAVANAGTGNISILKNNGDGTFQTAVDYVAGNGSISVFSVDLDADGDNDLAVANYHVANRGYYVSILKNNGNGTFQAPVNYGVGVNPRSVFSIDLDNDDDYDLAVGNWTSNSVSILLNNGDGTFPPSVNYGVGSYPASVFSADLDGDGDNDLAVANSQSNTVSVLINSGCGELGAYHFNGADQYLSFSPYNPGTSDFTIEGWVNMDSHGTMHPIFYEEQNGSTGRPNLQVMINSGMVNLIASRSGGDGNSQWIYTASVIPLNEWTYFACSREGGIYKIYINGQLDAEVDHGINFDVTGITSPGYVGRRYNSTYPGNQYYSHGAVDEIRVSNVARSALEISNYYASGAEMVSDGNTVMLWHMNGATGTPEKLDNAQGNTSFDLTEYYGPLATCGFNESLPDVSQIADKQAIIDYFLSVPFYENAESNAQALVDLVQLHVDESSVTDAELEAVLRLLLVEEAAKSACMSSDGIGAVVLANLTARCTHKAASALFLKFVFSKLRTAIRHYKDHWLLKHLYNEIHKAIAGFEKTLQDFNLAVEKEMSTELTQLILGHGGVSQDEARSMAKGIAKNYLKAWGTKASAIALEDVSQSFVEGKLTELNLQLYETGDITFYPSGAGSNPLHTGGTEAILNSAVNDASDQHFQDGNGPEVANTIRSENIPNIVASNTSATNIINFLITAGDWAGDTQLYLLLAAVMVSVLAAIVGILACAATGGAGCVISAVSVLSIWPQVFAINNLLSWTKIAVFAMGAGAGAFQLHGNLPTQLWEVEHVAFDQAPRVTLGGDMLRDMPHYSLPGQWGDSLAVAANNSSNILTIVRSQIEAGDWGGVQEQFGTLDSNLLELDAVGSIASTLLGYSYLCNGSDTLEGVDSILHYSLAHGTANDLGLALTHVALGFAAVAQPEGSDRDTLLMMIDSCISRLQAVGPAYTSAFAHFDSLGFTTPPIVVIREYSISEFGTYKRLDANVQNVSETQVHQILARLTVTDSSGIPIVPESDTLIGVLDPQEQTSFSWVIETGELDTLLQLELNITPDTLPGDFLGDSRLINQYYSTAQYQFICGDINADENPLVDISDLVYLVDYMFVGGPEPPLMVAADMDGSGGVIDIADLVYLVDFMFNGGPPPVCR